MVDNSIIVCTQFVSDKSNSTGYFWSKLIVALNDTYDVKVISTDSNVVDENNIIVSPVSYDKNKFSSRFLGLFFLSYKFYRSVKRNLKSNEIIITGTNPILLIFLLPILKNRIKFKWILVVHDLYPWNLFNAGNIKRRILTRPLEYVFSKIYDACDQIIVIGRDMKNVLREYTDTPIDLVQNWVSSADVKLVKRNESAILKYLNWGSDYTVFQFFGNMGGLQDIENILSAISCVKSERARFIFIGDGAKRNLVVDYIANLKPGNVAYYGKLDMSLNSEGLAACDIALVSLRKGMYGLGVPSKAYFSLAAGKNILAIMDCDSEISASVTDHNVGWCCEAGDPVALALIIDKICNEYISVSRDDPRDIFLKNFDANILLPKLIQILDSL